MAWPPAASLILALAALAIAAPKLADAAEKREPTTAAAAADAPGCNLETPPDRAIAACNAILETNPTGRTLADALSYRGVAHVRRNELDAALADAQRAMGIDPAFPRVYNIRGMVAIRRGQFDAAMAEYDTSLRLNPKIGATYVLRGVAWRSRGENDRAIKEYDAGIAAEPKYPSVYVERGLAYRAKGQVDREIADFTTAISLEPKSARNYDHRAWSLRTKREYDRSLADSDEAIRLDPRFAAAYSTRALTWRAKENYDRAFADLSESIRLDPKSASTYLFRSSVWRSKGNLDKALVDLNTALQIDPGHIPSITSRGQLYESRGDRTRAIADYTSAVATPARGDGARASQSTAQARLDLLAQDQAATNQAATNQAATSQPVMNQAAAANPTPAANQAARQNATPSVVANAAPSAKPTPPTAPSLNPASSATPAMPLRGDRLALVIGNGRYVNANMLPNPVSDAQAVAKTLRDIGFQVSEGHDLDNAGMQKLVRAFLRDAANAKIAVLYYAGHGMQVDGKNYLIPVDASLDHPTDLEFETLDVEKITAGLDDEARANIIILDACRDNPLARSFAGKVGPSRSAGGSAGLAPLSIVGSGTLIAYATAPGKVALDGDGANSPFTTALIKYLRVPGIEVRQMLTRVRADVVAATKARQVPWDNSSLLGDVFLADAAKP